MTASCAIMARLDTRLCIRRSNVCAVSLSSRLYSTLLSFPMAPSRLGGSTCSRPAPAYPSITLIDPNSTHDLSFVRCLESLDITDLESASRLSVAAVSCIVLYPRMRSHSLECLDQSM
jgi:hypothetical protein